MCNQTQSKLYGCSRKEYIIVSSLLILSFLLKLVSSITNHTEGNLNSWEYSEFLINFQGGFIRRGLVGEMLFQSYKIFSYPLKESLFLTCYLVFFAVLIFFLRKFHHHKYCWWLIFSPLFLNFTFFVVRKDYILYALLIAIVYILRSISPSVLKKVIACLLVTLCIFIHEAFIFWGFVLYSLLMLSYKKGRLLNFVLVAIPFITAGFMAIFKGTPDTPMVIINSWNSVLPDNPLEYRFQNSIGAIGWDSKEAFLSHLKFNLSVWKSGVILIPLFVLIAYYMFSNFLFVLQGKTVGNKDSKKLVISLLYSSIMICLIPMLTILSCDIGRVFQYATITTFTAFLLLPTAKLISIYPGWYVTIISKFNTRLNDFLPPSKGLMIVLLLLFNISPVYFNLFSSWNDSVIGTLYSQTVHYVYQLIAVL